MKGCVFASIGFLDVSGIVIAYRYPTSFSPSCMFRLCSRSSPLTCVIGLPELIPILPGPRPPLDSDRLSDSLGGSRYNVSCIIRTTSLLCIPIYRCY
jgi:hypothetical protein